MVYNIVFTIYGLLLTFILLLTFFVKKKPGMVRSKIYGIVIFWSLLFCIVEIIEIHMLYYLPKETFIISTLRRINHVCTFSCISYMVIYYKIYSKDNVYKKLSDILFKSKSNFVIVILNTIISLLFLFVKAPEILDINNLMFLPALHDIIVCYFGVAVVLVILIVLFKKRKQKRKLFLCLTLIFVLLFIGFPFQLLFQHVSLVPSMTLLMIFIIYFTMENPDIDLLEDVSILKENIDKSSSARIDFLFQQSYDLITPINTIISLSNSLCELDEFNVDEVKMDISNINIAANNLVDTMNDIFELNDCDVKSSKYSLYELLNDLKSFVVTRLGVKNVVFDIQVDDLVNTHYIGDVNKIRKILKHILSNSVKYTDVGKITLNISASGVNNNMVDLKFRIIDTGCGIKDQEKSFIFSGSKEEGSFNLSKCKELLSLMKGTISFDSVYGAGCSFVIYIPQIFVFDDKLKDMLSINDTENEVIDCSQYKILIVDDVMLDITVMSRLLEKYKCQISYTMSTKECINKIKIGEEYDLMFLDHKMLELSGVDIVKVLRILDGYKLPKIICLTANNINDASDYYISNGFDDYLAKPIDIHELDRVIKKYLKK